MKAILEFNLPEDQWEFDLARDGCKWKLVAEDLRNEMRSIRKYENNSIEQREMAERLWEKLHYLINNYGLEL